MNQHYAVILPIFWLLSVCPAVSQVGFSLPIINDAQPGSFIEVPVEVSNFDSVVSMQFVLRWDPAVLEFDRISRMNLPDLDLLGFSTNQALDSGIVRFRWYNIRGATLRNGTSIFTLRYKVIGARNTSTVLRFAEIPPVTYFEVVRGARNQILNFNQVKLRNGQVAIGFTLSASDPSDNPWQVRAAPNPFTEQTVVAFDLPAAGTVQATLTDWDGRIIFFEKKWRSAGPNGIVIASSMFNHVGAYLLRLQTNNTSHVQKLIFQ
jgi:Cohesin domain